MNINGISVPVLLAGTLLAGGAATAAQAAVGSAHAAKPPTARPNGIYSAGGRHGQPLYQSVLVTVDKTARRVTVDQRCNLKVPGRKISAAISSRGTFSASGTGVAGHMTARGHFIDPNAEGHFGALDVTITSGCTAGSTRTWEAVAV